MQYALGKNEFFNLKGNMNKIAIFTLKIALVSINKNNMLKNG